MEDCLRSERIQVERKQFFLDLKENARGRFLRITEDVNGRRDAIILPITGLTDFRDAIDRIIEFNTNRPDGSGLAGEREESNPGERATSAERVEKSLNP